MKKNNTEKKDLSVYLRRALVKLEGWTKRTEKTAPYLSENKKLLLLRELVKEQIPNENSHRSARPTR